MRKSKDHDRCLKSFKGNQVLRKGCWARQHPLAVVRECQEKALLLSGCAGVLVQEQREATQTPVIP